MYTRREDTRLDAQPGPDALNKMSGQAQCAQPADTVANGRAPLSASAHEAAVLLAGPDKNQVMESWTPTNRLIRHMMNKVTWRSKQRIWTTSGGVPPALAGPGQL